MADERIVAAWLGGSFGTGIADDYSDIDLHLLIADEHVDDFRTGWVAVAQTICPVVVTRSIPGLIGGWAITPDWLHLDVICYPAGTFDPAGLRGCRPLADRVGILPIDATTRPKPLGQPYFPQEAVQFYFYLLGNLAVVLGRGELTLASNGAIARRDLGLVPLMLAENGVSKSDGAKRLNPYLTREQIQVLHGLPAVASDRESIIRFDQLVAAEMIKRGRPLARATGQTWPEQFEAATLAYLNREIGFRI